jgi:hypothetical protein
VVPGTARWPHVDQPDLTAGALREWWVAEGPPLEPASEPTAE